MLEDRTCLVKDAKGQVGGRGNIAHVNYHFATKLVIGKDMPRKGRIGSESGIFHVMMSGDRKLIWFMVQG